MADPMQQARELLPCPFCGEANHLLVEHLDGTIIHPAYQVRCDNCGASSGYTDRSCAELWNTRAALRSAPEWQPIETAPRDGTRILLWDADRAEPVFGRWIDDGTRDFAPMTHWAPAVAGPAAARPQEASDA
ncbi:Lar family restriction alleviation protein [Stenotrophomonas acidaminiphila]|uniref:Lar family restriction alleviation protein n=1 Tax=Stenotrophomonas acidaminiphila TaxID=128780 RepID=UPI001FAF89EF|nr:Lar family restriction alleviation protein [Stenotrophomonas acidaminiphila]